MLAKLPQITKGSSACVRACVNLSLWSAYKSIEAWTDSPDHHTIAPLLPLNCYVSLTHRLTIMNIHPTHSEPLSCVAASPLSPSGDEMYSAAPLTLSIRSCDSVYLLSPRYFSVYCSERLVWRKSRCRFAKQWQMLVPCGQLLLVNLKPSHNEE